MTLVLVCVCYYDRNKSLLQGEIRARNTPFYKEVFLQQ